MQTGTTAEVPEGGGTFLLRPAAPEEVFTPEDFTHEHEAIARTTEEFFANEVAPRVAELVSHSPAVGASLLRRSAELGLTGVLVPESYGGMDLDLISAMIVTECISADASYSVWHSVHTGLGTLPLLFYGTEQQKQRYLPKLAAGEMIGSYCLTEASSGSDALVVRTRAELAAGGRHYVLNGQKMWASNAGAADLFTVFARVDGERFTGFLVERGFAGVSIGAEEKKMGIRGSSTCPVYLDNVKVPVENVLGQVGRGHVVALNILDAARLMLGFSMVGGAKRVLQLSLRYAKQREAFGRRIAEFGLIREKLALMATRIFAAETLAYRVAGMIMRKLDGVGWQEPDAGPRYGAAFQEFAAECAMVKIFATEAMDYVADEGVQIHGGYGYHPDYEVERAYRDSRVGRIFEGTNEINRLAAANLLVKRSRRGQLPVAAAIESLQAEALGPLPWDTATDPLRECLGRAAAAKKAALLVLDAALRRFAADLGEQQEILAAVSDMATGAFIIESACLRARKRAATGKEGLAADLCHVLLREAIGPLEAAGRQALAACAEGDELRTSLALLRRFTKCEPVNTIALRRRIAGRLLEAERYRV